MSQRPDNYQCRTEVDSTRCVNSLNPVRVCTALCKTYKDSHCKMRDEQPIKYLFIYVYFYFVCKHSLHKDCMFFDGTFTQFL